MHLRLLYILFLTFSCLILKAEIVETEPQGDSTETEKLLAIGKKIMSSNPDSTLRIVIAIYDTTKNLNSKATCAQVLGVIYKQKGQYEDALTYYLESYDLFKKLKNVKGEAFSCNNIGIVYYSIKNYEDARTYLNKSIALKKQLGMQKEMASSYVNIANIFMKQYNFDSCEYYYKMALEISLKYKDENNIFTSLINLGETYLEKKEYKKAILFYNKALKASKEEYQIASCNNALGKTKVEMGNLYEAKIHLDKAIVTAIKLGNRPFESNIYENYSKLYEKQKEFQKSLEYLKKFQALKDTLLNSENTKRMEDMKNQYEMKIKDEQISALNKDYAIKNAEAKRSLILKNSFIIAFVFILIISLILYRNVKIKQKSNLILREKNRQIEIHQKEIEQKNIELGEYNKELMRENISAKYEILKSKINPHFLFNSLSTLSSLVMKDQRKALDFVSNFSKLYRNILELGNHQLVRLDIELNFSENYLALQKYRFGDNLSIKKNVDVRLLACLLPPFSLQLVLENALKHNMISTENQLEISIYTEGHNIIVKNNIQKRINVEASTGIGQESIKERYKMFTDKEPVFEENNGIYVAIIPLITPRENI